MQTFNLVSYGALLLLNPLLIAVMVMPVFLNSIVNNKAKEVNDLDQTITFIAAE